jgi:hypothetical protein
MKSVSFFVLFFFFSLHLTAKTDTSTYAPFDWIKINPNDSFIDFEWERLPRGITQVMLESLLASPYITSEGPLTLVYFKEQLLAVMSCRFEVLKWTGDRWENLYKGAASGFNCHPHFFVREGKLYSMGRYGFWRGHSELIWFDFETGFWEPIQVAAPPLNYRGHAIFVDGDHVFSILGQDIHQPSSLFQPNINGYVFDFKSQAWSSIQLDFPSQSNNTVWSLPSFDLKDYGLQVYWLDAQNGLLLFNKKENSLYFSEYNNFGKIQFFTMAIGLENKAVFFDKIGDSVVLELDETSFREFKKLSTINFTKQSSSLGMKGWAFPMLGVLGLLLVVGGGYWWRKNQRAKRFADAEKLPPSVEQDIVDGEVIRIIEKLLAQPLLQVDVHQLDELLGISSLENLDYTRVRRSRYIKAVNQYFQAQHGKELIVRTKSEVDKRVILYRILP